MLISFKNKANGGGGSCDLQELEAVKNGTYSPEGFDGYSTVNVALPLEEVQVDINENGTLNVVPNTGKEGMTKVCINTNVVPTLVDLNETITTNGPQTYLPDPGVDGYGSVQIDVNVPEPKLEEVSKTIAINGNSTITPSAGFDGISKVQLNVNVPGGQSKISVKDTGIKFGNSTFTEVPEIFDFTGVTNGDYMFAAVKLTTPPAQIEYSKITDAEYMFGGTSITTVDLDLSSAYNVDQLFSACRYLKACTLNISKARYAGYMFSQCEELKELYLKRGVLPNCSTQGMFEWLEQTGIFFYDLGFNYDPVIKALPGTWKAQPLGDVLLKIRVLKDTKWLEGDQNLTLNGNRLTYKGQGLYEVTETLTKDNYQTKSTELQLDNVKIGDIQWLFEEQTFTAGDNSAIINETKTGADILTLVAPDGNPDGWAFNEEVQGVKSPYVNRYETQLKLNVPGYFSIEYGQKTQHKGINYGYLTNGTEELVKFSGVETKPGEKLGYFGKVEGTLVAGYHRKYAPGSDDDFWINSISLITPPPYPSDLPTGTFNLKVRVLKDTQWVEGDQNLTLNGTKLNYSGKGLYEVTETITEDNKPSKTSDLMLDGVKIGQVKWTNEEQIVEAGDNSSITTEKVGADILTMVPDGGNTDGWAYDPELKGVKTPKVADGKMTQLELTIPENNSFTMVYGQDTDGNDYAQTSSNNGIGLFLDQQTGPDGEAVFESDSFSGRKHIYFVKDSSGSAGLDAFWIKSIVTRNLPPYPEV